MKFFTTCLFTICLFSMGWTQSATNHWTDISESQIELDNSSERTLIPQSYRTLSLELTDLKAALSEAPMEFSPAATQDLLSISLPLPDGSMEVFEVVESPIMMPGLAAKYPHIKSFKAYGTRHKTIVARFDYSHKGFFAAIHTPQGMVNIDPYADGNTDYYISYYLKDEMNESPVLDCGYHAFGEESPISDLDMAPATASRGVLDLRTYRFALSCTGEFANNVGGSMDDVMAAYTTVVNRLNEIFEREVAIRMILIENNDELIHLSAGSDPYEEANNGAGLLSQNQLVTNSIVGSTAYDIGHILTRNCSDVGGIASLGSVCSEMNKARGVTCHSGNLTTTVTRVMAHEVGHQFSATHTMNMCDGNEENITGSTSYEPGSGTTIMSYAGVCGSQNVEPDNDDYFHAHSIMQMQNFTRQDDGSTCATIVPIGNNEPIITLDYEDGFFIPINTPFELIGDATDPDGDDLFFNWDGYNVGPNVPLGQQSLNSAVFRSFPPSPNKKRIFPKMSTIVNNGSDPAELLPTYSRNLTFRFLARDHHEDAGATVWEEVSFEAIETAGPFLVTHPNVDTIRWYVGDYTEVTWDVAGTNNPNKVNCQNVNIKLSIDGGFTYPVTLVENTPNDGSEFITVPNELTPIARVKIEPTNNIFFDISNRNFQILEAQEPGFALTVTPGTQQVCLPASANFDINTTSLLDYEGTINFEIIDGLPGGATVDFSDNDVPPGSDLSLSIDMTDVNLTEVLNLTLQAITDVDTAYRTLVLDVVSNDFSDMAQLTPTNGETGVNAVPEFTWMPALNATYYDIEIATDPNFGDAVIETATDLTEASYMPGIGLEESTVYYWRIRANNRCGAGSFLTPSAFQTVTASCTTTQSIEVPVTLPGSVTTRESTISITASGTINDLKLPKIKGTFGGVNSLVFSLEAPDETTVVLFNRDCGLTNSFDLGFNDDAAEDIQCPPTSGLEYRPTGDLSDFDGKNTQGTWKLIVDIQDPGFGSGGSLDEWSIEFCASLMPNAPYLVNNEAFPIPPGARSQIGQDFLLCQDDDNTSAELIYTLVTIPTHGVLYKGEEALAVGSTFQQNELNSWQISYEHDGGTSETDNFVFTVHDGTGGWFGTPTFDIEIFDGAPVGTTVIADSEDIQIYPNPTSSVLNIAFQKDFGDDVNLEVYNVQGQLLNSQIATSTQQPVIIDAADYAAGIYFLTIRTAEGVYSKRFVVE